MKRTKTVYLFSGLAALLAGWALLVWLDQGPVAVVHENDPELAWAYAKALPGVQCRSEVIPVALAPGKVARYKLVGELCAVDGFDHKTLQVLVSGAGYGAVYWDFPYEPDTYSYMRAALRAGYAVFNFDRLGMGRSDHPPGLALDVDTQAYVLSQTIAALAAANDYSAVVTLGHSFGSLIVLAHALRNPEQVNGVVLTGYAHNVNPEFGPAMGKGIELAAFGGPFVGDIFDPTYVISKPDSRGAVFYTGSNTDPAVIRTDDLTRQTTAAGELLTMRKYFGEQSKGLQVPVYMVLGEDDFVVCGGALDCTNHAAVLAHETPYFPPATCFELTLLDDVNHNANLHRSAPSTFALILNWIARRAGTGRELPTDNCSGY
jgi:pimeloyl-ACP methyl ester carboxylesterase